VESLASILLTLFAIALIIAFAKAGTKGVAEWLQAKFVGKPRVEG
jgi:hypothetical protein